MRSFGAFRLGMLSFSLSVLPEPNVTIPFVLA